LFDGRKHEHDVQTRIQVTTMSPKRQARPRIQRAFLRWFQENRCRFNVRIELSQITDKGIRLRFPEYPDVLSVWLSRWDLSVCVDWQGESWDMLISLDAIPEASPSGYRCTLCENAASTWSSREALWRDHLFEPFLEWANQRLAAATWLRLYRMREGGSSWATYGSDQNAPSDVVYLVAEFRFQPQLK